MSFRLLRTILLLSVALSMSHLLSSQSLPKARLFGKCDWRGYLACTQYQVYGDGTYESYSFMDIGGTTIHKGKWIQLNGDTVILNTEKQPAQLEYTVNEYFDQSVSKDTLIITLNDEKSNWLGANLVVNEGSPDEHEEAIYLNKVVLVKRAGARKITLYFGDTKIDVIVKTTNSNRIDLLSQNYDEVLLSQCLSCNSNQTALLSNRRLKLLYKDFSIRLKRVPTRRKQW